MFSETVQDGPWWNEPAGSSQERCGPTLAGTSAAYRLLQLTHTISDTANESLSIHAKAAKVVTSRPSQSASIEEREQKVVIIYSGLAGSR